MKNNILESIVEGKTTETRKLIANTISEKVFDKLAQVYKTNVDGLFESERNLYDKVTLDIKKALDYVVENTSEDYSNFDEIIVESARKFNVDVAHIEACILEDSSAVTNAKVRQSSMNAARGEREDIKKKIDMIMRQRKTLGNPLFSQAQLEKLKRSIYQVRHKAYGKTKSQGVEGMNEDHSLKPKTLGDKFSRFHIEKKQSVEGDNKKEYLKSKLNFIKTSRNKVKGSK